MVRVMDAAGIAEDLAAYPLMHFIGGNEPGVLLPALGVNEVNWRIWPALVIVSHGLFQQRQMMFFINLSDVINRI